MSEPAGIPSGEEEAAPVRAVSLGSLLAAQSDAIERRDYSEAARLNREIARVSLAMAQNPMKETA